MADRNAPRRRSKKAPAAKTKAARGSPAKRQLKQPSSEAILPAAPEVQAPTGEDTRPAFPIVGIGASAGGLQALETFLSNVPNDSGMAFVVIQHLDPDHKDMLAELLQRATKMQLAQARNRMAVEANHVYVIPPGKDMSILHGVLYLVPQPVPRGLNLPIDFFFRTLADDQQERAIGVILSGMGSDGTLGLRAIKEKAGATFVESLESARFDGMPRSAITAGVADVVAPVGDLPGKIHAYARHTPLLKYPAAREERDGSRSVLDMAFVLLRTRTGNDFSSYKRGTILRRVERRMSLHQIDSVAGYVRYLRENPREIDLLFKELLIGVTNFFRDPASWDFLKTEVMPGLITSHTGNEALRAWVPGCSTGEEAYSLAIVFREAMDALELDHRIDLQIFATDLDREAVEAARSGVYPDNIAADVSTERLRRYFVRDDHGYRVNKQVREMVIFAPQNLISDPPFTKLDILSCRNLLIYLSSELQKKIIPLFHYSLNPGGVLLLGTAETVGAFTNLFMPLDPKTRVYRKTEHAVAPTTLKFSPAFLSSSLAFEPGERGDKGGAASESPPNLQAIADRLLADRFGPVGILCNVRGDILYISARAGRYLEPAVGKANLNIFAMAREGLRYELSGAFSSALRQERPVRVKGLQVGHNGGVQTVDLTVQKLDEPKDLRGTVMVVLGEGHPKPPAKADKSGRREPPKVRVLELEIQRAREEVQTTREEMQTSQEELKSTNEELQSTNEELQSMNEELTTSKEEMQSLNEELQTVNQELQAKVDELSRSNNDMKNLLNSTEIATLFLDDDLRVRRFTTPTAKIIKLIPGDAGRPVTDLAIDLDYPDLADDAREVLRTLVFKEKLVATRAGHWFTVRLMPYRTLENVIDGVVITFTDASAARALEGALRDQAGQLRQLTDSLPNLVWGCTPDGSCDFVSRQWVEYTGVSEKEQLGYGWIERVHPDQRDLVRETWRSSVTRGTAFDMELRIRDMAGDYRWFKARSVPIRDRNGAIAKWYGTGTDIDDLKRAKEQQGQSLQRLSAIVESIPEGCVTLDGQEVITFLNAAAERTLGRAQGEVVGQTLGSAFPKLYGVVKQHIAKVLADGSGSTFDANLTVANEPGAYRIRLQRQQSPKGVLLFFQPLVAA